VAYKDSMKRKAFREIEHVCHSLMLGYQVTLSVNYLYYSPSPMLGYQVKLSINYLCYL
jgi:hypothetical protein